jgi:hypothetical protein
MNFRSWAKNDRSSTSLQQAESSFDTEMPAAQGLSSGHL